MTSCGGETSDTRSESLTSAPTASNLNSPLASSAAVQSPAQTAQEIALNSITAMQKIKFLKFNMDFSMSFTLPTTEDFGTMTMHQIGTSSINLLDKEMYMNMQMEMETPQQGRQNMSAEIYSTDGWMYMKANVPGAGEQWTKMELTEELWAQQCQLSSVTNFLQTPTNLELAGSERIGTIDCYLLNVTPDLNSLSNWMAGQMQPGSGTLDPGITGSQTPGDFTVKQWIDKSSLLPVKQLIKVKYDPASIAVTPTANSYNQMTMEMSAVLNYYDFGKSVTIQLPAEALNAKVLSPEQTP